MVDFDGDGLFESGGDDDVSSMYLESGGGVARNGEWADDAAATETNTDEVKIHWSVEDVDDTADVKIYLSSNSSLTTKSDLLAEARQIGPDRKSVV